MKINYIDFLALPGGISWCEKHNVGRSWDLEAYFVVVLEFPNDEIELLFKLTYGCRTL
jgi:hypothetical protein